jgi:hypothetical protein
MPLNDASQSSGMAAAMGGSMGMAKQMSSIPNSSNASPSWSSPQTVGPTQVATTDQLMGSNASNGGWFSPPPPSYLAGNPSNGTAMILNSQGVPVAPSSSSWNGNANNNSAIGAANINPSTGLPNGVQVTGAATQAGVTPTFTDQATGVNVSNGSVSGGMFGLGSNTFQTYSANPNAAVSQYLPGQLQTIQGQISGLQNAPINTMQASQAQGTQAQAAMAGQTGAAQGFQNAQLGLAGQLQTEAAGGGPNIANMQLQQANSQAINAQMAMANSHPGQAGAAYNAAVNAGNITQQNAAQSSINAGQQQLNAQNALAGVSSSGQQIQNQAQQFNAGNLQQANLANASQAQQANQYNATNTQNASSANLAATTQQQQYNNTLIAQYISAGMNLQQAQQQANVQMQQYNAGLLAQQQAAKQGISINAAGMQTQAGGAAVSGLGSAMAGTVGSFGGGGAVAGAGSGSMAGMSGASSALAGAGEGTSALETGTEVLA